MSARDRDGAGGGPEIHRESGGQRDWSGDTLSITLLLRAQAVFNKELHTIFKDGHSALCRNHQLKIPCGDRLESQPLAMEWRWEKQ